MKIHPVGTENGRTDTTKLKVAFRKLANASREKLCILPGQCIYVFRTISIINHAYFTKHFLLDLFFFF